MAGFHLKFLIWVMPVMAQIIVCCSASGFSWCPQDLNQRPNVKFKQKTGRYWMFDEKFKRWVELKLPFELESCVGGNCTKVSYIEPINQKEESKNSSCSYEDDAKTRGMKSSQSVLPVRRRISLSKMSEASIWVTGESGSIYERFWNGVQWVIAPHDLPVSGGFAVSVFIVNQTILTLSEAGTLYQLQLGENSQPFWSEFRPAFELNSGGPDVEIDSSLRIKSGLVSHDGERLYFATNSGLLLELCDILSSRWMNYGSPPGGNVAAIVDVDIVRPDVIFTVSYSGDLYEFDKTSKPSWKKHIWIGASAENSSLSLNRGCAVRDLLAANSLSLFLLTKNGYVMERRLHQRKWKWIVHRAPKGHNLTAITPSMQNDVNEKVFSLFVTTDTGFVFEYQLPKYSGPTNSNKFPETWVNHFHPQLAKVARGVPGLPLQYGRMVFPLDDGRLAELHLSGVGGENSGPTQQVSTRRRPSHKYEWAVIDAPETEGWNAEYCTNERGPSNCLLGMRDTPVDDDRTDDLNVVVPIRRRKGQNFQNYLLVGTDGNNQSHSSHTNFHSGNGVIANFRMRAFYPERSIFLVTDGLAFEYLHTENVWIWLRHDHSAIIKGVMGSYNGSLFLVDTDGNLFARERNANELSWVNCTALKKGRPVAVGPPWDVIPGNGRRVTAEDSLFFVTKNGRLLRFTVALRKFKWKDCQTPPNTKIAYIVDQELFRSNIVFVIGRNGRLYQYNKVTGLWHVHNQSPHLVLSKSPGTAVRSSMVSLTGSLFMFSEDGGLIEYHYNSFDGWLWVEHGTPSRNVTFVGAPGPCFDGTQLFLIGSDGNVYLRYLEERVWKWKIYYFPFSLPTSIEAHNVKGKTDVNKLDCSGQGFTSAFQQSAQKLHFQNRNCDDKVSLVRPIPTSGDSVIFELRDGRVVKMDSMRSVWVMMLLKKGHLQILSSMIVYIACCFETYFYLIMLHTLFAKICLDFY